MPKLLIVAATYHEVSPLVQHYGLVPDAAQAIHNLDKEGNIQLLVTGVGMVNTAYAIGKHVNLTYNLIINAGICGAFKPQFKPGQVLCVTRDCLSEMGAENGTEFIPYHELGLGGRNEFTSVISSTYTSLTNISQVSGITVNTVHGNEKSIEFITTLLSPDVESMEGAAFLMACEALKCDYFQLRAVSNYVEKRDKSKWEIKLAIQNLNQVLLQLINEITTNG